MERKYNFFPKMEVVFLEKVFEKAKLKVERIFEGLNEKYVALKGKKKKKDEKKGEGEVVEPVVEVPPVVEPSV